jgi:glycerophosphoryl diester phosphodiesterase
MSRLVSMGVDGLITDEPRLARTVLRDRSRMGLVQRMLLELLFLVGGEPDRTAVAQ